MAISNSIKGFKPETNYDLLKKADELMPKLIKRGILPKDSVRAILGGTEKTLTLSQLEATALTKGDTIYLDFGEHLVGYFGIDLKTADVPADAPAYLRIKFAEQTEEFLENCADYNGQLSSSWLQEEKIHIDEIPSRLDMPRRYAFRYVEIEVLDTSPCYKLSLFGAKAMAVSCGDLDMVEKFPLADSELEEIERLSLITMRECMQEVVEDGPKRDRRLWIGDLRLAAMINGSTFKNNDIIKRCIYLFAALRVNRGRVGACLYVKPEYAVGDVALFDYSLFFVSCLYDYYMSTGDKEILAELWDVAYRQIELSCERLGENDVVEDSDDWWSFIDWNDDLNKQAPSQAVFIYTVKQAICIAKELGDNEKLSELEKLCDRLTFASRKHLWDEEKGFFVSGAKRQVSWATQVWFILAGVTDKEESRRLVEKLNSEKPEVGMVTPYMYHHYVEALFECGMKDEALGVIREYWGEMVKDGANAFYEIYNPKDKAFSPYGSKAINSYCHAWSATPVYLFRKYLI